MAYHRFASACLALSLVACSTPVYRPAPDVATVYVIERGWHTDIGLAVEDISGPLRTLEAGLPGVRTLIFGFGERQFLMDRHPGFGAMLRALLPNQSALLITALATTPQAAFGAANVVTVPVSQAGLEGIEAGVWRQFELSATGALIRLAEGPYSGSTFYAARDTYDALYTCNTWTAATLRAGGVPVPVAGVLFAGQVMGVARWVGARLSPVH